MAFTAREVIMTFRGQNYLSGAIRRIGADVGGLSRTAQLSQQRAMLQARAAQLNYAKSTAQAELFSVTTGTRALGLQRARAQLGITERRNVEQLRKLEEQRQANLIRQATVQQRINALAAAGARTKLAPAGTAAEQAQIDKALGSQVVAGRGLGRVRVAESLRINQAEMERLAHEADTLNMAFSRQSQVVANSSIATQQLAAREIELVQREGQLRQAILSRTRAIDENTIAQSRNNYESTKIAPIQAWSQRAAQIEHAGRALMMFGLIGTAAIGAAAASAAKFNTQFTLAATQARPPGAPATRTAQIATEIQRHVLDMMQKFPASAQDMADSFYQIFSGTNIQNVNKASQAVRVFNQMAVAGGTDLKTMTDAGITLYNNFGGLHGEFQNLTQAGNAFFATVRYGRMNAEQFANALPNIAGIARQVGLSFNDIAGAMATLTRQTGGRFTSRDATGIARMIEVFARPDFIAGAAKLGVNIKDAAGNMRPLLDIISDLQKRAGGHGGVAAIQLFKEISSLGSTTGRGGTQGTNQARRAFAYLINDINRYRNVSRLVRSDNDELSKSFLAMSRTPGVQWQVFINRLRVLVYEIGTQAIPAFMKIGEPLARAVHWFNGLNDGTKKTIATFLTFVSAGALVVGLLSSMFGGLARVVAQIVLLHRIRGLESMIGSMRLASTAATAEVPIGAAPLIINPRTGTVFSRTAEEAGARRSATSRLASEEAGSVRPGIAIGLGAAALTTLPILAATDPKIGHLINTLGGLGKVMTVITALSFTPLIRSFAGVAAAAITSAARTSAAWVRSSAVSATSFIRFRTAGIANAESVVAANTVAAEETSLAWKAALISTGWGALIVAIGLAAEYAITHWSRVKRWFGVFWTYMKATGIAAWQALVESGKTAAYLMLQYVTIGLRGILKAATFIPGIRGSAKEALREINHLLQTVKPDYSKIGSRFSGVIENDNRRRAAQAAQRKDATDEQTANARRMRDMREYWRRLHQNQAIAARNNRLDTAAGINPRSQRTVQQWISAVERARRATLGAPRDLQKAMAYERIQAALNKRFKDQPALLAAINDVLQTYDSSLKKTQGDSQKLANSTKVTFEQVLSGLQQRYQQFFQQEQQNFGTLFQGPFIQRPFTQDFLQYGGRLSGTDLTKDLQSQITQFQNFHSELNKLSRRGAPQELIAQLTALGPQALDQIKALERMTDPEIRRYFGLFRRAQQLIHKQAMADLNRQLADYRRYGRNIALQIIAGLRDENQPLARAFARIIHNMFGRVPTQAQVDASRNNTPTTRRRARRAGTMAANTAVTSAPTLRRPNITTPRLAPLTDITAGRVQYRSVQEMSRGQRQLADRVAFEWVGNAKRLNRIIDQFGNKPITRARYEKIYADLSREISRELRRQHLPRLSSAQMERLIRDIFGFRPLRERRHPNRSRYVPIGQEPGPRARLEPQHHHRHRPQHVEYHDHYHVTAPKSEHTSVKAQIRHGHFAKRNRHRPSR